MVHVHFPMVAVALNHYIWVLSPVSCRQVTREDGSSRRAADSETIGDGGKHRLLRASAPRRATAVAPQTAPAAPARVLSFSLTHNASCTVASGAHTTGCPAAVVSSSSQCFFSVAVVCCLLLPIFFAPARDRTPRIGTSRGRSARSVTPRSASSEVEPRNWLSHSSSFLLCLSLSLIPLLPLCRECVVCNGRTLRQSLEPSHRLRVCPLLADSRRILAVPFGALGLLRPNFAHSTICHLGLLLEESVCHSLALD